MKGLPKKLVDEALSQIQKDDPKAAEAAKAAVANAERVVKELVEAQDDEVRQALKKASESRPLNLRQLPGQFIPLLAQCSGSVCTVGCGAGCVAGCLAGGAVTVGFGAAAGGAAGAGTAIALE